MRAVVWVAVVAAVVVMVILTMAQLGEFGLLRFEICKDPKEPQCPHCKEEGRKLRRYAVIIHGSRMDSLQRTAESIRRYVVEPMDADVFVGGAGLGNDTGQLLHSLFGERIKGLLVFDQLSKAVVLGWLSRSIALWKKEGVDCTKRVAPPSEEHELGSGFHRPPMFHFHYAKEMVFEMLVGHELSVRGGVKYDAIYFFRPDFMFLAPVPPMSLTVDARPNALWLASRTTWNGYPEGQALCARRACDVYGRLFSTIFRKSKLAQLHAAKKIECGLMSEIFFRNVLLALGVRVAFFSNVASLVCKCDPGDYCSAKLLPICAKSLFKYATYEYYSEHQIAVFNADRINRVGWSQSEIGVHRIGCSQEMVGKWLADGKWPQPRCLDGHGCDVVFALPMAHRTPNCKSVAFQGNIHWDAVHATAWGPMFGAAPQDVDYKDMVS